MDKFFSCPGVAVKMSQPRQIPVKSGSLYSETGIIWVGRVFSISFKIQPTRKLNE